MAYDDVDDEPSGLVAGARNVYKKANDFLGKIPTMGVKTEDTKPAPDDTHKRLLDEANKSFIHKTETPAQKKAVPAANGKIPITKSGPRKRM